MSRVRRALLVLLAVLYICSGVRALPRGQKRGLASAKHVIIFGCDGFGEPQLKLQRLIIVYGKELHSYIDTSSSILPRWWALISTCAFTLYGSTVHTGGMYLENATSFLPNVNKFYTDGAHTTVARDQMPSVSAPNWGMYNKLYRPIYCIYCIMLWFVGCFCSIYHNWDGARGVWCA